MAPMEFTRVAAAVLVSAAWEGLVLAGVVAISLRMLPAITAAARSIVWTVAMLAVCGLPFVHFGGGAESGPQIALDERIGLMLVAVWALISFIRAGQLVRSAVWLRGVSRRAVPVTAEAKGVTSLEMTESGREAEICASDEVDRPCVVGFWWPRILVPCALMEKLNEVELRQIVLHEMEHLRRRDDWTNLLQKLSLVVFPLNPALLWIERRLCAERELACDDRVLQMTGARKAYAACLANLAEHSLARRGVSLALGAWERQSEVVRRVHRILAGSRRNEMSPGMLAGVVTALVCGVLAGADGLARVPALVQFGPGTTSLQARSNGPGLKPSTFMTASFVGLKSHADPEVQVRAQDVVFHAAAPAKMKRRAAAAPRVSMPMVDAVKSASNLGHPVYPGDADEPVVLMVTWSGSARPVIVQDSQFTYAAVPTRNGWLFVQL